MVNSQKGKIENIEDIVRNMYCSGQKLKNVHVKDRHKSAQYIEMESNEKDRTAVYNIFEPSGLQNCHIVLVEVFPCETKYALFTRESLWGRWPKPGTGAERYGPGPGALGPAVGGRARTCQRAARDRRRHVPRVVGHGHDGESARLHP